MKLLSVMAIRFLNDNSRSMIIGTKEKVKKSKHFKRGGGVRSFHKYYDFLNFWNKGNKKCP